MRDCSVRNSQVEKEYPEKALSLLYRKENGIRTISFEYLINPPIPSGPKKKAQNNRCISSNKYTLKLLICLIIERARLSLL
jgi:hypothetical protein